MSYVDDRETFFSPDKDTAMSHGMTAQYLNEVVDKRNGMEVVDADGDIWGWVYDCHKDVGKWVQVDTHDRRVEDMSEGMGQPALLPDYEPYRFVIDSFPTNPDPTEPATHLMTAQYLNECVHKHIGLAVVDRESDTWGWVHDQHKNESGWVIGDTHDDRIQELRDGAHVKPALPAEYEKYEFVEEIDPTETTYAKHPVPASDPVNPGHYRSHPSGVECIQITEHMNFNLGNTIKYVWRAGLKTDDPAEDIKKALWYLRRELSRIEAES